MDVALVSCTTLPEPDPDAEPLGRALAAAGIDSRVVAWEDPGVDWTAVPLALLRSTWNYPLHHREFLDWAAHVAARSRLWNPLPVVRWNSHKAYLLDLERAGVPVAPTELVRRGSDVTLAGLREARGWETTVVKPAVSAASFRTGRFGPGDVDAGEAHLRGLAAERDVLVQPFLPSVEAYGERALIWIDGELTHAVRKTARFSGDDESVSERAVEIAPAEAALARRALDQVGEPLAYARVDIAPGLDGKRVVMELELIEPSLFFGQSAAALDRFVGMVRRLLE